MFLTIKIIYISVVAALLIPAAISDVRYGKVNNIYSILICVSGILITVIGFLISKSGWIFLYAFLGALIGLAFTAVPAVQGSIGGADVKISASVGLGAGVVGVLIFLLASMLSGSVFYIIKEIVNKIRTGGPIDLKRKLPLVPFMIPGMAAFLIFTII